MKTQCIFDLASRLRDAGNAYIVSELEQAGLTDIAPSHGIVLQQLFKARGLFFRKVFQNNVLKTFGNGEEGRVEGKALWGEADFYAA